MARGVRATVAFEGDNLVVTPVGFWAKLASISAGLKLPLRHVVGATTTDEPRRYFQWWARVGGTSIPGMQAGRYGFFKPRTFVILGRSRPAVVVTLDGFRYNNVLFTADDPEATAQEIERRLQHGR